MIGIDTNILVRLLARDDEEQYGKCVALVRQAGEVGPLFVNPLVATETVWVLERRFGVGREKARRQVVEILDTQEFIVPDRLNSGDWTSWFANNHPGFFDIVIASTNAASGCLKTVTFDKRAAARVPGMELLA